MKQQLELEQKQILKLSQEMKLSFHILSMSYEEVLQFWLGKIEGSYQSTESEFFENLREEEDFYQYLENQLMYFDLSESLRQNLLFCIHNLNESGFLEMSDLELCYHLRISPKELEKLYQYLYELQPLGVGTHNYKEAIRLQLQKKQLWEETIWDVLNHLEYIASGREKELALKLGISSEHLEEILKKIRACNPKPSRGFWVRKSAKITPDFYLKYEKETFVLEENEELQRTLYRMDLNETLGLQLLRKCIEKRTETLRKILEYIVERQKDYFLELAPLHTLHEKEIAKALGFHASTISRAIQNKYIKTEKGIFSIKALLCYSEEREQIKLEIETIINQEDKNKPYSDSEIATYLEREFLWKISRRTISKYREELGYLSSFQRKWK